MEDLPSTERGPRQSDDASQTGTGTPRSADAALPRQVDVGGGTSSHPADADETNVNRSGSGGSGGPSDAPNMEELLGDGDGEGSSR